jgi:hypothetical protein
MEQQHAKIGRHSSEFIDGMTRIAMQSIKNMSNEK